MSPSWSFHPSDRPRPSFSYVIMLTNGKNYRLRTSSSPSWTLRGLIRVKLRSMFDRRQSFDSDSLKRFTSNHLAVKMRKSQNVKTIQINWHIATFKMNVSALINVTWSVSKCIICPFRVNFSLNCVNLISLLVKWIELLAVILIY